MFYSLLRETLFLLPPEVAHRFTLQALQLAQKTKLLNFLAQPVVKPQTVMGLTFPNRVGLAAGFDRNAEYIEAFARLGFGFIEVGTITPKAQMGNAKPRLFRLTQDQALINRMGFYGKGCEYAIKQLKKTHYRGILGINIGKNKDTPNERAVEDYVFLFKNLWPFASYITINISSPNTEKLRDLQQETALNSLLMALKEEQQKVASQKYVPLVVKISPDLDSASLHALSTVLVKNEIDAVIVGNSTIQRPLLKDKKLAVEKGGLSGRPLNSINTAMIRETHSLLQNQIPIIGVGGIMDAATGQEKLTAGASLLQLYTGLIYQGPQLIAQLASF